MKLWQALVERVCRSSKIVYYIFVSDCPSSMEMEGKDIKEYSLFTMVAFLHERNWTFDEIKYEICCSFDGY